MKQPTPDILCISNLDWDSAWQRHHEFMTTLSEAGHRIFFLNNSGFTSPQLRNYKSILKKLWPGPPSFQNPRPKNLKIIQPKIIPPRIPFNQIFNNRMFFPALFNSIQKEGIGPGPIIYTFLPSRLSLGAIDYFKPSKVIYDYVSDFEAHLRKPKDFYQIHHELLERCNLLLTDSEILAAKIACATKQPFILHHGVAEIFFLPRKGVSHERLRACYFGTIDSKILDFTLLNTLIDLGYLVDLIGPIKGDLGGLSHAIQLKSQMNQTDLAHALSEVDILLLPYLSTDFNATVTPAKLYQCLATGKPLVVQGLPALRPLGDQGLLRYANNREEFTRMLKKFPEDSTVEAHKKRQGYAHTFSSTVCQRKLIQQIERIFIP